MKSTLRKLLMLALLLIGAVFTGCFRGEAKEEEGFLKGTKANGGIEAVAVYGDKVYTDRTMGGEEVIPSLTAIEKDGMVTFEKYVDLNEGEIVLITPPDSKQVVAKEILQKVSGYKYTAKDAEIEEVFQDLDMTDTIELKEDFLNKSSLPTGVTLVSDREYATAAGIVDYKMVDEGLKYVVDDYVIYQSGDSKVTVNGSVLLKKPKVDFDFSWRKRYVDFTLETGDKVEVKLEGKMKEGIEKDIDLGTYNIPITVYGIHLGSIDMGLAMRVSASGKVQFIAKATQNLDASFGVGGKLFSGIGVHNDFKVPGDAKDYFTFDLEANGAIELAAGISPKVNFTLLQYSVFNASGNIGVKATGEAIADIDGLSATNKATINPYLLLKWKVMGLDERSKDFLENTDWKYEITY